jgi:hypothetical protein
LTNVPGGDGNATLHPTSRKAARRLVKCILIRVVLYYSDGRLSKSLELK